MIGLEIAGVVLVLVILPLLLLRGDKVENGGLYFWQRSSLLANGSAAQGHVLDHAEHSPGWQGRLQVRTVDLVVEFTPQGAPPLRVPLSYRLPDGAMNEMTNKGRTIPLRYDARQPDHVLIDWPALGGGPPRVASREERDADKARQAALLRGDK